MLNYYSTWCIPAGLYVHFMFIYVSPKTKRQQEPKRCANLFHSEMYVLKSDRNKRKRCLSSASIPMITEKNDKKQLGGIEKVYFSL